MPKRTHIHPGEFIGKRFWNLSDYHNTLFSIYVYQHWMPGYVVSAQQGGCNGMTIPTMDNQLGIYAFKDTMTLSFHYNEDDRSSRVTYPTFKALPEPWHQQYSNYTTTDVWGEVYLWGHVVEHDWGYRAQYAYPKQIMEINPHSKHLHQMENCGDNIQKIVEKLNKAYATDKDKVQYITKSREWHEEQIDKAAIKAESPQYILKLASATCQAIADEIRKCK